jgi:hypothetical protein
MKSKRSNPDRFAKIKDSLYVSGQIHKLANALYAKGLFVTEPLFAAGFDFLKEMV